MPNQLHDLVISEISLVDRPANSLTDPVTGQKVPLSTIALRKRDATVDPPKKEKVMTQLKLSQILKSDNLTFSREAIAGAVRRKAQKLAAKKGISIEKAELRIWKKHPEAMTLYDNAPVPIAKRAERRTAMVTRAEAELDDRARRRMQKFGENYAKACKNVLEEDPSLYSQYETAMANGATYATAEPPEYLGMPGQSNSKMDIEEEDDDGDDAVPDHSMYARRGQSTSGNGMTSQERKGKMRR